MLVMQRNHSRFGLDRFHYIEVKYIEDSMVVLEMVVIDKLPLYRGGRSQRFSCIIFRSTINVRGQTLGFVISVGIYAKPCALSHSQWAGHMSAQRARGLPAAVNDKMCTALYDMRSILYLTYDTIFSSEIQHKTWIRG